MYVPKELLEDAIDRLEKYVKAVKISDEILAFHSIRTGYQYEGPVIYPKETMDLVEKLKECNKETIR